MLHILGAGDVVIMSDFHDMRFSYLGTSADLDMYD